MTVVGGHQHGTNHSRGKAAVIEKVLKIGRIKKASNSNAIIENYLQNRHGWCGG